MRIASRLALLCGTVLTAMALGATTVTAAESIEVDNEGAGGANCNPCTVTVAGESHHNVFGVRVSTCTDTASFEIYHNGTGHMSWSGSHHDSGGTCTRQACTGFPEALTEVEFDILSSEETSSNAGTTTIRFCFEAISNPNGTGLHCLVPVDYAELATNHRYRFDVHSMCADGFHEYEAAWATTGGSIIEIVHL